MRAPTERRLFLLLLIVAALLLLAIGRPMLTRSVYTDSDLANFHLPFHAFYAESLRNGEGFIWCPYEYGGFYLHGEGQAALYHPFNWLIYRFLPLDIAFNVELLRNYAFLLIGIYLLARRWAMPRDAAMTGALLFALCGFCTAHFMHLNVMAIVAHLPFSLLAADIALRDGRASRRAAALLAVSLTSASALLFGHPQTFLIGLIAVLAYAGFLLWRDRRWGRLVWLSIAQVLALPLAAVQLIAQWESLLDSQRATPGEGFALTLGLDPINLAQFVSPLLFTARGVGRVGASEFIVYDGALLPVLLAWLWIRRRDLARWRVPLVAAAAFAALTLVLALGAHSHLYRLLASLPLVDLFRGPARVMLLFHLVATSLAAFAFADLAREAAAGRALAWGRLLPLGVPLCLSLVVACAALLARALAPEAPSVSALSSPLRILIGPALFAGATALVLMAARGRAVALTAIVIFLGADLAFAHLSFVWRSPSATIDALARRWPRVDVQADARLRWAPPLAILRHVRLASGYVAMQPRRRLRLHVLETELEPAPAPGLIAALRVAGIHRAYGRPVPDPLPRVRLLSRAERVGRLNEQMGRVDVATTALVERDLSLDGGEPGRAAVRVDRPGDIRVETRSSGRRLLVVSESYHRGWRAEVDGTHCEVLRVYGDFLGCVVPAGAHVVHFVFDPSSLRIGRRISLASLAPLGLLYLAAAHPWRRNRR